MNSKRLLHFIASKRFDWLLAGVALLLALLPVWTLKPWTNDVARIVIVPFVPVTHVGMALRDRIRPPHATWNPSAPETIALINELSYTKTLYEAARLESARLEGTIAALNAVSTRLGDARPDLIEASVVALDPSRVGGAIQVNAGERNGVVAGAAVFINGDLFAGVVSGDIGAFVSTVIPSLKMASIGSRLYPREGSDPRTPLANYPGAVLKPTGRGTWTAEVASAVDLRVGLFARVSDDRLPRAALGTIIGRVIAVEPIEQVPLARRIEVEPIMTLEDVSSVIICAQGASTP